MKNPLRALLNRIKHTPTNKPVLLGVYDRHNKEVDYIPFSDIVSINPTGIEIIDNDITDNKFIPYHRIISVLENREVIYESSHSDSVRKEK
ncbi:MAG: DUF504 domain-containing protein [Candidatus Aenigmarchaeota archaeon]|nr:DUF504 domain-containing protein [Candidatus Aenigmarchaeota archaeon]